MSPQVSVLDFNVYMERNMHILTVPNKLVFGHKDFIILFTYLYNVCQMFSLCVMLIQII